MSGNRSPKRILLIVTISHVMQHIYVGSSILIPLIIEELELSYTEFGLAIALSSLISGLTQILFSVASRKIARHILLGLGNILLSLGTFLTGLSRKFIDFLSAKLISNIGVAPQHPMGTAIISEEFDERSLGGAIGFHYGVAYMGNIVGPLIMTILAASLGWRITLFIFSIPALTVGLTVIWYLNRARRGQENRAKKNPGKNSLKNDVMLLMKTRSVIPILAAQALLSGGIDIGTLTTYIPVFLADFLRMDIYERGMIYTIGLLGGVLGPVILGIHAGRMGYTKTASISVLIASILTYLLIPYEPETGRALIAAHLFTLMFMGFSMPTLLQSQLVKVTSGYNRDLAVGLFLTIGSIFNSIWVGLIGHIIDSYMSFRPALIIMGSLGLITLPIIVSQTRRNHQI